MIAILDADHSYGRICKQGAVSVGIVVRTNCVTSGHGLGVTTLFTSTNGKIFQRLMRKPTLLQS